MYGTSNEYWTAERNTYEDEVQAFVTRHNKWTQDNRYGGRKCNYFHRDGTRCKFDAAHTQKHSA